MTGKRSALIVASDQYSDSKLKRLRSPSRDAAELARVLSDPSIGNFTVELAMNESEAAVRRKLSGFFASAGRDDLLVLHIACHGVKDDDGNLYFATTDTETNDLMATAVRADFVELLMSRSPSRRIVLLLDCCYSGAFARGMRARGDPTVQVLERFNGRGRAVLTASNAMEYAWEGDDVSGEGLASVFTGAVVKGLETGEADRDGDGHISVDELYDYVLEKVREATPKQTPNKHVQAEGDLIIAESVLGPLQAYNELPRELLQAITSPFAEVRSGAVMTLGRLARTGDPNVVHIAEVRLHGLANDDSRMVSLGASKILAELEATKGRETRPNFEEQVNAPTTEIQDAASVHPAPRFELHPDKSLPFARERVADEHDGKAPAFARRATSFKLVRAIYLVFGLIEAMLLIRFALKALGANAEAGFAQFIYGITGPLVAPLLWLFGTPQAVTRATLELHTLIALVIYALVAWLLARGAWLVFGEGRSASVARTDTVQTRVR